MTYEDGKIRSAGNAWCITETCEIYEMEMAPLCAYG